MFSKSSVAGHGVLEDAANAIVHDIRSFSGAAPVVLIDGYSGSGKTTLAAMIVERCPVGFELQSIALDSLYPGWDGLEAGVEHVTEGVLRPYSLGVVGTWTRWDWERNEEAESHRVDPCVGLLIEGSGVITPETAALADICVWMELAEPVRKARALARDGDTYRPHWERWAVQEHRHVYRDDPRGLATRIVDVR